MARWPVARGREWGARDAGRSHNETNERDDTHIYLIRTCAIFLTLSGSYIVSPARLVVLAAFRAACAHSCASLRCASQSRCSPEVVMSAAPAASIAVSDPHQSRAPAGMSRIAHGRRGNYHLPCCAAAATACLFRISWTLVWEVMYLCTQRSTHVASPTLKSGSL